MVTEIAGPEMVTGSPLPAPSRSPRRDDPEFKSNYSQMAAIEAYARSANYQIVETFHEEAVSGADPVDGRPQFAKTLERLMSNGARTIIVESPDRFALLDHF